ncbi:flagellar hook assembly protein FlgD [Cobetia sp. Ld8]|uniref:flagellar hook assembly protein FlgD n=1 Tax=Cobetia sp. Ld8 TaxID=649154 RepID=UPI00386980C0
MATLDTSVLNSINQTTTTSGVIDSTQSVSSTEELNDQFMTLLVAQMQNQDPMDPVSNSDLTAQLAQISTVSGIEELNTTLEGITAQISSSEALQAASLLDQGVLVGGNAVLVGNATSTPFGLELADDVDNATVEVLGADGSVVKTFELGALEAGIHGFVWDGLLDDGTEAADGSYQLAVTAERAGESYDDLQTLSYGVVSGVNQTDSGAQLDLGPVLGVVSLDAVRQVL